MNLVGFNARKCRSEIIKLIKMYQCNVSAAKRYNTANDFKLGMAS